MKCPVCQHEMVQSKNGWLCLGCGHAETASASSVPLTQAQASAPVNASESAADVSSTVNVDASGNAAQVAPDDVVAVSSLPVAANGQVAGGEPTVATETPVVTVDEAVTSEPVGLSAEAVPSKPVEVSAGSATLTTDAVAPAVVSGQMMPVTPAAVTEVPVNKATEPTPASADVTMTEPASVAAAVDAAIAQVAIAAPASDAASTAPATGQPADGATGSSTDKPSAMTAAVDDASSDTENTAPATVDSAVEAASLTETSESIVPGDTGKVKAGTPSEVSSLPNDTNETETGVSVEESAAPVLADDAVVATSDEVAALAAPAVASSDQMVSDAAPIDEAPVTELAAETEDVFSNASTGTATPAVEPDATPAGSPDEAVPAADEAAAVTSTETESPVTSAPSVPDVEPDSAPVAMTTPAEAVPAEAVAPTETVELPLADTPENAPVTAPNEDEPSRTAAGAEVTTETWTAPNDAAPAQPDAAVSDDTQSPAPSSDDVAAEPASDAATTEAFATENATVDQTGRALDGVSLIGNDRRRIQPRSRAELVPVVTALDPTATPVDSIAGGAGRVAAPSAANLHVPSAMTPLAPELSEPAPVEPSEADADAPVTTSVVGVVPAVDAPSSPIATEPVAQPLPQPPVLVAEVASTTELPAASAVQSPSAPAVAPAVPPSAPSAIPPGFAAAVASSAPGAPLIATTHPGSHGLSVRTNVIVVAAILAAAMAFAATFYLMTPTRPMGKTQAPIAAPSEVAYVAPEVTTETSPQAASAILGASDTATLAASRDAQRKTDLQAYADAYAATRSNGYLPVRPAVVTVSALDPSTNVAYVVQTTAVSQPGHIEYRAGGSCGGQPVTPGKSMTRQVALYTLLENDSSACVDIK